jgi:hypothetical protein
MLLPRVFSLPLRLKNVDGSSVMSRGFAKQKYLVVTSPIYPRTARYVTPSTTVAGTEYPSLGSGSMSINNPTNGGSPS